jgi:hypothetical protein
MLVNEEYGNDAPFDRLKTGLGIGLALFSIFIVTLKMAFIQKIGLVVSDQV